MDELAVSLPVVVGLNLRRIRRESDLRSEEISKRSKVFGINWSMGRLSDIEAGRGTTTVGTLVGLAAVLGALIGRHIKLAELVETDAELIDLGKGFTVRPTTLIDALSGDPLKYDAEDGYTRGEIAEVGRGAIKQLGDLKDAVGRFGEGVELAQITEVHKHSGEAERHAAATLKLSPVELEVLSARLWKKSLSQERDRRAGPTATAKQRGHITRTLKAELKAAIEAANSGG